jgi:osmotically-inducible protein OsmY
MGLLILKRMDPQENEVEESGMVIKQTTKTRLDEIRRSRGQAWSMTAGQNRGGSSSDMVSAKSETSQTRFVGLIHRGQNVFSTGDQPIGRILSLLPGDGSPVSYLVIRTPHFWGRLKLLPVEFVSNIKPKGVWLSIDRSKFRDLADYKTDAAIKDEVESSLWSDPILRITDYPEISVGVKNGVVSLVGHTTGMMNQKRIDDAVRNVTGVLGVSIHLIADDKLLLKVAGALSLIGQGEENHVFAHVENGVVVLSGEVSSIDIRNSAEQYTATVADVRGVINNVSVLGIDLAPEDQRFIQPSIGEEIIFRDGLSGFVTQVIINQQNRRVVAMIIQGQFPAKKYTAIGGIQVPDRLAVIPMSVIRYITRQSGFLLIDSTEINLYQDFDPANFVAPDADWVPPYPYNLDDVKWVTEK